MIFSWSDYVRAVATSEQIPSRYRQLRVVQLAQAIVESARGSSQLFQEAGNPGGLKWRDGIDDNYTEKITNQIWLKTPSEPNGCYWCQWKTPQHAAMGYWRFIGRPNSPYQGWEAYDTDPEGYLQYIWQKGYATDPSYVSKVKNAFPEAQSLLEEYGGEQPLPPPSRTFKVAIMPGHGGTDSGAVNHTLNLREKDYNWKEAVEIKARLEAEGNYQVVICREENELAPLSTLQQRANDSDADVCLCLHHNASNKQARGWWLFYVNRNYEFEKFIKIVDKQFRGLPFQARGYEYAGQPFAEDWFSRVWNCIHCCTMPTILFESCFIDNDADASWLRDGGYKQIVEKICAGIKEYLGDKGTINPPNAEKSVFVNDTNPPLNVRSGAGTNYTVVGQLQNETLLKVEENNGQGWLRISKPIAGWVSESLTRSETSTRSSLYTGVVNDPEPPLNVRSDAGTNFSIVGKLNNGTSVEVVEDNQEGWVRISSPLEGWVAKRYVKRPGAVKERLLHLVRTNGSDEYGCKLLTLSIHEGDVSNSIETIKVVSGVPSRQDFETGGSHNVPNSLKPLPQGDYSVQPLIDWAGGKGNYNASFGPGLGPVWVPITPKFQTPRGDFGFHLDKNRTGSPGSAGCIVFTTDSDLRRFVAWFDDPEIAPKSLTVDWGL
jgi:N-acetylmuramoyl-L-alanine amidase/uncharacterized protein YraI